MSTVLCHSVAFNSPNEQGGATVEIESCDCQDMRGFSVKVIRSRPFFRANEFLFFGHSSLRFFPVLQPSHPIGHVQKSIPRWHHPAVRRSRFPGTALRACPDGRGGLQVCPASSGPRRCVPARDEKHQKVGCLRGSWHCHGTPRSCHQFARRRGGLRRAGKL